MTLLKLSAFFGVSQATLAITCLSYAGVVSAQAAAGPTAQAGHADGEALPEIVVTATKRTTNVQTTPLAISALSADALRNAQVQGLKDLQQLTPSLIVSANAGQENPIALRGISSGIQGIGGDSPVAIYLDGVYIARPQGALFQFSDIERIEVLRGPQGTLFGRNNTGGAINIITALPNAVPSASFGVRYGSRNELVLRGALNGPITDSLFLKIGASHRRTDGDQRFADTGRRANPENSTTIDAGVRFVPSTNFTFDLRADYSKFLIPTLQRVLSPVGSRYGLASCPINCDLIFTDQKGAFQRAHGGGVGLTTAVRLGAADLKSITAYRDLTVNLFNDIDYTDVRLLRFAQKTRAKQFTQELNLSSHGDTKLKWIVGVYYFHENSSADITLQQFQTDTRSLIIANTAFIKTNSYAAYANIGYDMTPRLTVSAGLRYSHEKKNFVRNGGVLVTTVVSSNDISPRPAFTPQYDTRRTFSYANPRADIQYKLTDANFVYASYSTGNKSGGFATSAAGTLDPSFGPEKITAYELGSKNTLFDRQLRLNLSAFYYQYSGLQVALTPQPGVRAIFNAASATIKGADLEVAFAPSGVPGLRLSGSLALLDAKYKDFRVNFATLGAAAAAGQCFSSTLSPALVCEFSGHRLPRSPQVQLSATINYKLDLGRAGVVEPSVQASSFGRYFYLPNNDRPYGESRPYTDVDGQLTWSPASSQWRFGVWVRNLTNERHITNSIIQTFGPSGVTGTPFPGGGTSENGFINAPRSVGIDISSRF